MTRRSDQLDRIEASLARLEQTVAGHDARRSADTAAVRADLRNVRSSADAALAGTVALAAVMTAAGSAPAGAAKPATPMQPPS